MSQDISGREVSLPTRLRHAIDDMRRENRPFDNTEVNVPSSHKEEAHTCETCQTRFWTDNALKYHLSHAIACNPNALNWIPPEKTDQSKKEEPLVHMYPELWTERESKLPTPMKTPHCVWCDTTFESLDKFFQHRYTTQRWKVLSGDQTTQQCRLLPISINDQKQMYGTDEIKVETIHVEPEEDEVGKNYELQTPSRVSEKRDCHDSDEEFDHFSDLEYEDDGLDSLGMSRAHFSASSRDPGLPHPQYSSGVPKSSFMSSFSNRQSPMMPSYSSRRKAAFGLGSPRSYNTAKSSVASYVTAAGSPAPAWSQEASQLESGKRNRFQYYATALTESTAALASYDALVDEVVLRVFTSAKCTEEGNTVIEYLPLHEQAEFRNAVFKWLLPLNINRTGPSREVTISMIIDKLLNNFEAYEVMGRNLFHDFDETRISIRDLIGTLIMEFVPGQTSVPRATHGKVFSSEWLQHLQSRGIILDPKDELDWSGRGQHVEYDSKDISDIPLRSEGVLGYSASAMVDRVICRRIRLARKKIKCHRRLTKEDAIKEVEHLQKLQHSHIIRVVGTYTFKKELAILLYPATHWNLEEFMDEILDNRPKDGGKNPFQDDRRDVRALISYFGCLSAALAYVHSQFMRHMDIKPKNLLVQQRDYKIYIADFGIARAYQSSADGETDTPVAYTRTYAAPEVVDQDTRGFSADVFSLGCVFLEIFAVLLNQRNGLSETRSQAFNDTSYSANLEALVTWVYCEAAPIMRRYCRYGQCVTDFPIDLVDVVPQMINKFPNLRPPIQKVADVTGSLGCGICHSGSTKFVAAIPWD